MVPEETQTSTSSTAAGITSGTECAGGDGPSSAVLGSAGQVSTDGSNAVDRQVLGKKDEVCTGVLT